MKLVDRLEQLAQEIVDTYGAAARQLDEWAAGHPAAVIGASAPTAPNTADTDENNQPVDNAARIRNEMDQHLTRLATTGRTMWANHDGTPIPEPADTVPARLAVIMWTIRRTQRDPHAIGTKTLERYGRRLQRLADLCHTHQPPARPVLIDCCHAHKTAGIDAEIDANYRRYYLCRWCGDFRQLHDVNPPPRLVRLHDRGIRMTTSLLRSAGIRVGA